MLPVHSWGLSGSQGAPVPAAFFGLLLRVSGTLNTSDQGDAASKYWGMEVKGQVSHPRPCCRELGVTAWCRGVGSVGWHGLGQLCCWLARCPGRVLVL